MDKYSENKFGFLKEKSLEELIQLKKELEEDRRLMQRKVEDKKTDSYQRSEFLNSDLPFNREELEYVDSIISERKKIR